MSGLRVLFIGGSGVISSACSRLAVERGIELFVLNRGRSAHRPLPVGDKAHSMVFDNSKLRRVVPDYRPVIPFEQGAREIVAWHDEDPSRQQMDLRLDRAMDQLIDTYRP